jgi:sugar phosphate isomerase/epimerase
MTREAGLSVVAYGSYFRAGEDNPDNFEPVFQAALALDAPVIRVWAGRRGSKDADPDYRARVLDDTLSVADRAATEGIAISYEYHADTLTDTDESARQLLIASDSKVQTLWQPPHERTVEQRCQSLRGVVPWLSHVHVFHWPRRGERAALEEGAADWVAYLKVLREEGKTCPLLLEFVRGDDPEQFRRDARTLRELISSADS